MSLLSLSLIAIGVVGCGKGEDADPNYEQKVTLSAEDKAKAQQNMAGQSAPGAAPGTMPMPAGKGR